MRDIYSTDFAALGLDFPDGRNAFQAVFLPPAPVVLTEEQLKDELVAQRKRRNAERARAASKRKYAKKRDPLAFAPSQITLDPDPQHTSDKLAKLVGKPSHKRSS